MKPAVFLSGFGFLLLVWSVPAGELRLTVEASAQFAATNNLDLAAARLAVLEAKSRVDQAGKWSNPEIELEVMPHVRGREGSLSAGFSQRFPLTSRLRLEKKLVRTQLASAQFEVQEFERKLALQVRMAAIRLAAQDAKQSLKARQISNNQELARTARESIKAGEGSDFQALQLDLESAKLITERATLANERLEILGELRLLLSLHHTDEIQIEEPLFLSETLAQKQELGSRPDHLAAKSRLEAAEQSLKLTRAQRWEDLRIGLFEEFNRSEDKPNGIETDHFVGIRFSLPLPLWDKKRGKILENEASILRAQKEAESLLLKIQIEAETSRQQMEAAGSRVRLIQESLPKARSLEERVLGLQKEGLASFTEVLRMRERRLELETAELEARLNYHLARARYLAAVGVTSR